MNAGMRGVAVGIVVAAVVAVTGAGVASAATPDRLHSRNAAATGAQVRGTHTAAEYLGQLNSHLVTAVEAENVDAVRVAVRNLRQALAALAQAPLEKTTLDAISRVDAHSARIVLALPDPGLVISSGVKLRIRYVVVQVEQMIKLDPYIQRVSELVLENDDVNSLYDLVFIADVCDRPGC